jgi:F-type H+-transporting ATPase subunit gamma
MSEDLERVQSRLGNISAVEPILGALRTISLGSWQGALKRQKKVDEHNQHFVEMLQYLLPLLLTQKRGFRKPVAKESKAVIMAVGSERGLCGRFNNAVAEYLEDYAHRQRDTGFQAEVWVLGSRLARLLVRGRIPVAQSHSLSVTALPQYRPAYEMTRHWLERYEAYDLDRVDVLYNAYRGTGHYEPDVVRLIPPQFAFEQPLAEGDSIWPTPIIETDPESLYSRVIEQITAIRFHQCLLGSAASEHSARYQLMEEATQNADRLILEMTDILQMYRRQKITQEMQELAVGAGLLQGR